MPPSPDFFGTGVPPIVVVPGEVPAPKDGDGDGRRGARGPDAVAGFLVLPLLGRGERLRVDRLLLRQLLPFLFDRLLEALVHEEGEVERGGGVGASVEELAEGLPVGDDVLLALARVLREAPGEELAEVLRHRAAVDGEDRSGEGVGAGARGAGTLPVRAWRRIAAAE